MDAATRLELLRLGETSQALLGRREAQALGVSAEAWRNLSSGPEWVPVTPRVLRRAGAPTTALQRAMAAVLDVGPGAYLSHWSAAALWGLPGHRLEPVHVMVTRGANETATSLATTHRPRHLPHPFAAVHQGVPVVRPSLVLLQLAPHVGPQRLKAMLDRLWSRRLVSGPSVRRELVPVLGRGRSGTRAIRALLDSLPADYVPPASGLESRFDWITRDGCVGTFRRQVDLGDDDSWCGRVDFLSDGRPLVVEVQSEAYHASLTDIDADRRRHAGLRSSGFEVVEVWDTEVWHRPDVVVSRIAAALRGLDVA